MLLIPCPHCGPRDQNEFTYGGDTNVPRDGEPHFLRDNPRGPLDEYWHHSAGCRTWFRIRRDTYTHEIET
jgi:heterotetrameric sarcosine oxidase delta subunit